MSAAEASPERVTREKLIYFLEYAFPSKSGAELRELCEMLVDAYAHELAEKIRTTELPEIHVDMFDNGTQWAADLIDPKVDNSG